MDYNITEPGKIITDECYYFDQLCGKPVDWNSYDNWIHKSWMEHHLRTHYGLTSQQYYNIIVHNDINYTHECENPECHELTQFKTLKIGYVQHCCRECQVHHMWMDEDRRALQREVGKRSMEIINDNLWNSDEYEDFRERHSERMSELMTENNYDPEFSKSAICSGSRSYAINNFGPKCLFYIWTRDDYIKIGVAKNMKSIGHKINSFCPDYIEVYEGDTVELADLEYKLKMENQALEGSLEFFNFDKYQEFHNMLADKYNQIFTKGSF